MSIKGIKYSLIKKLIAQMKINIQDEPIKPNQFMIWPCDATVNIC
jgi:hypothetical protein